jgi:phage shock protein PspC (stress-responsive transcriptional regulator)
LVRGPGWATVGAMNSLERNMRRNSLVRPRSDRMIAGVCSGIARRFGISSNVVRIAFVASMLLPGPQILIYLAAWILMPQEA